ncbi:hypothetical protein KKC91_01970 [bacterium]|nr:hypothetical protein [bacterium]
MKYDDIEKYLSNFKIKEPKRELRDKVLLQSKSACAKKKEFSFGFSLSLFAKGYAYALILVLIVSIISAKIDSSLTDNLLNGRITVAKHVEVNNKDMEKLYAELGIDCKHYILLAKLIPKEQDYEIQTNIFEQKKQIMKELNLTNGGLS